ncbi:MAG TPA: mucoidy inhibitor MuiA family protein [Desulfuromonadales bacterium]|nr:mucoidy inhibitor MuiA family protein [Desulfuromonadales bacterium]
MKGLSFFLLLILVLTPVIVFPADPHRIPAPSRITAVTIYPDRALTTRNATLTLTPGSYLIAFDSLPTLLLDDSVRVNGKGSAVTTITGLEVRRQFLEQSGEKQAQELLIDIRTLEKRAAGLDAKKAGITAQKNFLESIRVAWGDRISKELGIGRPTSAELQDAATFVGTGIANAEELNREIDFDKSTIKDKIDALRRQLHETAGSGRKEVKTVEVAVECTRAGNLTLELAAMLPRASWEPAYDVRLAPDSKSADLAFHAMIRQQTGEEWRNIDLTLSTARPAIGSAPPELRPWYISLYHPLPIMAALPVASAPAPAFREKTVRSRMDYGVLNEAAQAEETDAQIAVAQIRDEQSSVSFHIPHAIDIPSDGSRHSAMVAALQVPVHIEYLAVPKLSPAVFLKSEIVNNAPYTLLPGKVNTFIGNSYTGSSILNKVAAGEKFDLFFGNDDQVTVTREELKQHKEAGLFGKNRVNFRYRIEMENFRKVPLILTLRDQLPVAGDEEVRVTLEEPSIKPAEIKGDGSVMWSVPLVAGEKKALSFGIMVEYPKDKEITGL